MGKSYKNMTVEEKIEYMKRLMHAGHFNLDYEGEEAIEMILAIMSHLNEEVKKKGAQ